MFIYKIINTVNGKIYVGQHKGEDLQHYLQRKFYAAEHLLKVRSHLYAAIRKYGRDAFTIEPLVQGDMSKAVLDSFEILYIAALDSRNCEVGYT
jgi:hypothetical protein